MSLSESALPTDALLSGMADVLDARVIAELRMLEESSGTALLEDLVATFRADMPERVAEIRAALGAGDRETVHAIAHGLRGSAGTLGAKRVQASAVELEDAAANVAPAALVARIDHLVAEWDRAQAAFARVLERTRSEPF